MPALADCEDVLIDELEMDTDDALERLLKLEDDCVLLLLDSSVMLLGVLKLDDDLLLDEAVLDELLLGELALLQLDDDTSSIRKTC